MYIITHAFDRAWKNFRIEELASTQGSKGKERPHHSDKAYQAIDKFYNKIPKVRAKSFLLSASVGRSV